MTKYSRERAHECVSSSVPVLDLFLGVHLRQVYLFLVSAPCYLFLTNFCFPARLNFNSLITTNVLISLKMRYKAMAVKFYIPGLSKLDIIDL